MNKLKITFVLPDLAVIGAQRVAIELGTNLARKGHEIIWLCGQGGDWLGDLEDMQVQYFAPKIFSKVRLIRSLERIVRLAFSLKNCSSDVIVSVTPFMNRIVCLLKALRIFQARLVIEDHAYPPRSYADEFPSVFERALYSNSEWLYCYSDVMRALTSDSRNYYKQRHSKINVIEFPNLMNFRRLNELAARSVCLPKYEYSELVYVGRFTSQKNVLFLIECFCELIKIRPTKLSIIGYGSEEAMLRKRVRSLGLEDCVDFLKNSANNFHILKKAKVFPLVSLWEGFPLVLIEAMSLGVAVVSVDCRTGPSELIGVDSARGWLVKENDKNAFVQALREALEQDEERARRVANAYLYVQENLDIDKRLNEYVETFLLH